VTRSKRLTNKRVIKLVDKILGDDKKRELYSEGELAYMEHQVELMRKEREIRKLRKKQRQGFGYGESDL
jgi:hypothetical protein